MGLNSAQLLLAVGIVAVAIVGQNMPRHLMKQLADVCRSVCGGQLMVF